MGRAQQPVSARRLFVASAVVAAVPVAALGAALALTYRGEARNRGVTEGAAEAALIAHTAVEPILGDASLDAGITTSESSALNRLVADSKAATILRLRLRDTRGAVVYSSDGSGFTDAVEDEALDAAHGAVVARLTRLNADANDNGPRGVAAVEVYRPLTDAADRPLGVQEIYLPYAPISADISAGVHDLYQDLALGLAALYAALFAIAWSVSRGLRRQVALNAFLAEHDPLTGLPNRSLFHHRAAQLVAGASDDAPVVIAIVDVDRFKEVNDTLGHHNGDVVLIDLARRLADHLGGADLVARLGGDEFGLLLRAASDPDAALAAVRALIEREVEVGGLTVTVEASIGYASAPADGRRVDDLLQRADVAMYVAKAQHTGVVRYDPGFDHYDAANLALVTQLRHAIDADQLVLHYQPKTALTEGRVEAVEALVRWQHPSLGLLAPDRFLLLAEQTDVIDKLTVWVLRRALADLAALGEPGLSVAVNVSARNLARPDFAARVVALLAQGPVPATRLIVEITETALLTDPARAATVLAELKDAGVRISLDDFGCGQTSLGYLSALPVHELKIDKSFVTDMTASGAHAAIVRSIVELGHNLSLRVVAEGVETADVLDALRASGCDVAQGYLLGRPMPIDALAQWLASAPSPSTGAPSGASPTGPPVQAPPPYAGAAAPVG
jgi:diguanylate cyclase (GGDEF)-like protein